MKFHHLLAASALAATATAVEPKNPATVAHEWNQNAGTELGLPADFSLKAVSPSHVPGAFSPGETRAPATGAGPDAFSPGPLYDAPNYRVPHPLPDSLPPGSKPWLFGDQTFWVVPLGPGKHN